MKFEIHKYCDENHDEKMRGESNLKMTTQLCNAVVVEAIHIALM